MADSTNPFDEARVTWKRTLPFYRYAGDEPHVRWENRLGFAYEFPESLQAAIRAEVIRERDEAIGLLRRLTEAADAANLALDGLMGDTDFDGDESDEMAAMQALAEAIPAALVFLSRFPEAEGGEG